SRSRKARRATVTGNGVIVAPRAIGAAAGMSGGLDAAGSEPSVDVGAPVEDFPRRDPDKRRPAAVDPFFGQRRGGAVRPLGRLHRVQVFEPRQVLEIEISNPARLLFLLVHVSILDCGWQDFRGVAASEPAELALKFWGRSGVDFSRRF